MRFPYFENPHEHFTQLGFITEDKSEYYKKINDKLQLLVVVNTDHVFFISEHEIIKPNNKPYEDDFDNCIVLSEETGRDEYDEIMSRHGVV